MDFEQPDDADRPDEASAVSRPPYGPPIHDAIASGDLQQMKATAEAARKALYPTEFESVEPGDQPAIKQALDDLDDAIGRLEQGRRNT